jgi:hypothetical protein
MQERNDQLVSLDEIDITTNALFSHVYFEGILITVNFSMQNCNVFKFYLQSKFQ